MIPELREAFNAAFDQRVYEAFLKDMDNSYRNSLVFRVSESPLFLTADMTRMLVEAAYEVAAVVDEPGFGDRVRRAVPPGMSVANETGHTTFLQVDFAICKDDNGNFIPQLIEFQGFPSLYGFQHFVAGKIKEYFNIPADFTPFFSGLDETSYKQLFGKILLGDSDPENVILLEVQPHQQKTRIDFYIMEDYFGIRPVGVTDVLHKGNRLYYRRNGVDVPIERIYHRFIFDELIRKNINCSFRFDDEDLDVVWVGHPNWFFKISKFTLPLIESRYCPPCYYLHELAEYPPDLENYVLKPLFSFAGTGVEVDVSAEMLDAIPDKQNFILQHKVVYTPVLKTPDNMSKAEVRMMFVYDGEFILVNNLLRLSQGKMMGVDYNKNRTWVGSSVALHQRP